MADLAVFKTADCTASFWIRKSESATIPKSSCCRSYLDQSIVLPSHKMNMQNFLLPLIALSALWLSAAGQACPSTICDSYFANAMGGPVDCCNHKYEVTSQCQWGGTPVSFTLKRFCDAGGKRYRVLIKGNSQGPASTDECRCKTDSPLAPPPPVPQSMKMTVELKAKTGRDIKGFDLTCDGSPFCKICTTGGPQGVQDECARRAKCVAYTFDPSQNCGYLKTVAEPTVAKSGWVVYSRA